MCLGRHGTCQLGIGLFCRGLHELDGDHRAATPDLADLRELSLNFLQPLAHCVADFVGALQHSLTVDGVKDGQGGSTGQWVSSVGSSDSTGRRGVHDLGPSGNSGQRQTAGYALGSDGDVRDNRFVFTCEHLSGAGEAGLDLVSDEDDVVVLTPAHERFEKTCCGHNEAALTLNRLDDDARQIFCAHLFFNDVDGTQGGTCAVESVPERVGARAAVDLRCERPEAALIGVTFGGHGHGEVGAAMVGMVEHDDRASTGMCTSNLDRILDRLSTSVEQRGALVVVARRATVECLSNTHIPVVRSHHETRMRERVDLLFNSFHDRRSRATDRRHGNARTEVDQGVPIQVYHHATGCCGGVYRHYRSDTVGHSSGTSLMHLPGAGSGQGRTKTALLHHLCSVACDCHLFSPSSPHGLMRESYRHVAEKAMANLHIFRETGCANVPAMACVNDILNDSELCLRPAVVADGARCIRWVAVTELADPTPFLEGSELVLTTGLATRNWITEWDSYVRRLRELKTSAIGFGVGLTHRYLPPGLINACALQGMNLLEVPYTTSFVSISQHAARLIERDDIALARTEVAVLRRLAAAATTADSTRAVIQTLGRFLQAACLLDTDGEYIVAPIGERSNELGERLLRNDITRIRGRGPRISASVCDNGSTIAIHPVGSEVRTRCYLATLTSGRVDETQRSCITAASALLGLRAGNDGRHLETLARFRTKTVELLLSGQLVTARLLLEVAAEESTLSAPIAILLAQGNTEGIAEWVGRLADRGVLAANIEGRLCAVVSDSSTQALAVELVSAQFAVGVGALVDPGEAQASLAQAKAALTREAGASRFVKWDNLVEHEPLALIEPRTLHAFASHVLRGLDERQRALLRTFLQNNGSRGKVAAELGIHRNTVQNRLAVVDETLGRSVDDPQVRATLWLALQALDYMNGRV